MKRTLFLMLLYSSLCAGIVSAQNSNMSVTGFRLLETDLTAMTEGSKHPDKINGKPVALVKIVTSLTGLTFEGDLMGIIGTEHRNGEWWVWLPAGAKQISIFHPQLGVLRNYRYPEPIRGERTYEMILSSANIKTVVEERLQEGYLSMTVSPANADVLIDEKPVTVDLQTGEVKVYLLSHGSHTYSAKAPLYESDAGTFEIVSEKTTELDVSLRPAYTQLQINSTPKGAQVFIDDDLTLAGTTPFTSGRLAKGSHTLKFQLASYLPKSVSVTVAGDGKTQTVSATLEPNFAETVVETADGADIYVDNQRVGSGRWTGRLDAGKHIVEARKASHVSSRKVVDVVAGKPVTEHFDALIPLLGKLSVTSSPAKASVSLDGKVLGTTPGMFPDILVGEHTLVVSKENYLPVQKKITVEEGKIVQENVELKAGQVAQTIAGTTTGRGRKNADIMDIFPELKYDEMVYVEGGTFTMGGTAEQGSDAEDDEYPTHRVTLSSYYIGKYEVTQALWNTVMGKNPSSHKGGNLPVEHVSWDDCQEFIRKLNVRTGKKFRLPTEAEWEYAARGGNKSKGYKYSGSNDIDTVAWYEGNSKYKSHKVGEKRPNELGLYDMSGNVAEWCQDWFGSYAGGTFTNPLGPDYGSYRVSRGSNCFASGFSCRVSCRRCFSSILRGGGCGLRLVLDP